MPTSPSSPASHESQPPATTDHLAWRLHVPALASAADGIKQASDAWDAVSDSFCDHDGWPIDEKGYADGKVTRDAEAWKHVEVFLAHGPEVLAGVRAAASGADYVEGPISEDLRRLRGIDIALERAGRIRHEWDQVMALMDASLPGSREIYASRAQEIRNSEGWHYADELSFQGPALVRAADYLANQVDLDQPLVTLQQEGARITTRTSEPFPQQATAGTSERWHGYGHVTVPLRQRGLECTVEYGLSDYTVHAVLPDGSSLIISPPQEPSTDHPPGHPESWLVTRRHPEDSAVHEVIYDSEPDGPHARHGGSVPSLLAAIDARLDQLGMPPRPASASPRVSAALAPSPAAQRTVPAQPPASSAVRPALPPAHSSSVPGR